MSPGSYARRSAAAALAAGALACSSGVDSYRVGDSTAGGATSTHPSDGGATGGDGSGGSSATNSGGASAGGRGTGGMRTSGGASGEGGVSGAGGMPVTPTAPEGMQLDHMLSGITAAAWADEHFFLLEAAAQQFWEVDSNGGVAGPRTLPGGTLEPNAFGASTDSVYVVGNDKAYRVPRAGSSTVPGVSLAQKGLTAANGAYANGAFLIGDASTTGNTAQIFRDADGMVSKSTELGTIHAVASDGSNFAFTTRDANSNTMRVHDVASAANMSPNATPCAGGSIATADKPVSVHGQTVAWMVGEGSKLLYFASVRNGVCSKNPDRVVLGMAAGPDAVGLIDDDHALVVDEYNLGTGVVVIVGRAGGTTKNKPMSLGGFPKTIVVGDHRAVIVGGAAPTMVRF